jgi:hypothetical protein
LEYHQLNPLLNAAAQQFAVDTSRAWANAAAAAALFASQLQQQNSGSSGVGPTVAAAQQQFQQAAALNLVSLQNFPFVDYARMMHVPNRKWIYGSPQLGLGCILGGNFSRDPGLI